MSTWTSHGTAILGAWLFATKFIRSNEEVFHGTRAKGDNGVHPTDEKFLWKEWCILQSNPDSPPSRGLYVHVDDHSQVGFLSFVGRRQIGSHPQPQCIESQGGHLS